MVSPRRFPLPTDRWVRLLLPAVLIFFAACSDRNYQTDLWHHLARGRVICAEGRLINEDRFTFTVAGQSLRDVNWGWQVLFFQLHELGGLPLVQTVNAGCLAVMMLLLVHLAWRASGSLLSAMGVGIFTFFGLWQLILIRPQTFSLVLYVLLLTALDRAGRDPRWLLAPPFIMALWVNVHGGFPIGLVLIGSFVLAEILGWPRNGGPSPDGSFLLLWLLCLAGSCLATLANPYGWSVYQYVVQTAGLASARRIDEWLPPSPNQLTGFIWVVSLAGLLVLGSVTKRRPTIRELCVLCCLLPLAAGSIRMIAWWLLAAAPLLAAQLADRFPRLADSPAQDHPTVGATLTCLALLAAMILGTPWLERINPALQLPGRGHRTETDLQAVADRLAAEGASGRIFTRFAWGEYLGWALHPHYTVFMDGRIEIVPDPVWAEYGAITGGRSDWPAILHKYGVTHLVLDDGSPYHGALLAQVRGSPTWRMAFRQGNALLFERTKGF